MLLPPPDTRTLYRPRPCRSRSTVHRSIPMCPPKSNATIASPGQDHVEDQRDVEEIPVDVLAQQREPGLAGIAAARRGDRAGRRGQPPRPVVGPAVVVAGQPEPSGKIRMITAGGDDLPGAEPAQVRRTVRARHRPAVERQARRVERRQVWRRVGGIRDEGREHPEGGQRVRLPPVGPQGTRSDRGPARRPDAGRFRRLSGHVSFPPRPARATVPRCACTPRPRPAGPARPDARSAGHAATGRH